ncbi:MAG: M12 family metallo-peptidase [Candidatus Poribacteria bacterium]|nr:M12 family metallo-peptidase [Candidatus Poribacteria bacterium]
MKSLVRNHKCVVSVLLTLFTLSLQCLIYEQEVNAQVLSAGEPRTVRLIYYLPNGRSYRAEVIEEIKTGILEVQSFFADQMEAHGHGRKTFQIETDDRGDPIVHRVDENDEDRFDFSANNFLIVRDDGQRSGHGVTLSSGKNGGRAIIYGGWDWFAAGHELGHAFGLEHDFRDNTYLMSYGRADQESAQLSACAAESLVVNPYFNATIPLKDGTPPTIEFLAPTDTEYALGTQSITIRARFKDSDGLHQVLLLPKRVALGAEGFEMKACRKLAGEKI